MADIFDTVGTTAAEPDIFDTVTTPPPTPSGFLRRAVADPALALLKGAIGLPEAAVGLADVVTGGYAGKVAEGFGFRPKEAKQIIDTWESPELQQAKQNVQDAQGFFPTVGAMVQNPSTIVESAAESAPSMIGGAGVARGILKYAPKALASAAGRLSVAAGTEVSAEAVAAGVGEGVVTAGQSAEQVRQESPDKLLNLKQTILPVVAGAITGALGVAGGVTASKLGIGDIDTLLAGGSGTAANKNLLRRVAEGAFSEGILEELPQSAQEQVAQNLATGKPWNEGVAEAAASGMLVGGLMGVTANARPTAEKKTDPLKTVVDALKASLDPTTDTGLADALENAQVADAAKTADELAPQAVAQAVEDDKLAEALNLNAPEPRKPIKEAQTEGSLSTPLSTPVENPDSVFSGTMAADYLLTGGSGVMLSTEYLLQAYSGLFPKAGAAIESIRKKYTKEINDNNLKDIKDFASSDLYSKILSEIKDVVVAVHGNTAEIDSIFSELAKYPTGMPPKVGAQLSSRLEALETAPQEVVDTTTGEITPAPSITDPLDALQGYASEKSAQKARGGMQEGFEAVQRPSDNKWVRRPKEVQNVTAPSLQPQLPTTPDTLSENQVVAPAAPVPTAPQAVSGDQNKSVTPNQVKGSISVYNIDDRSALGYDADTGVYTLREKGPDGPVDVATYEMINGKIQNFKTDATARDGFDREQQIQEAQSLVEKIEAGRVDVKFAGVKEAKNVPSSKAAQDLLGDTTFHLRPAAERLAAINSTIAYPDGATIPQGSLKVSKNSTLQNQLSKIARVFGHDVTLMADFPGRRGDGFWHPSDPKHVYIYETGSDKPLAVLGHELLHQMSTQDNALYKELGAGLYALRDNAAMSKYLDRYFPDADKSSVSKSTTEEWVADVLGHSMGNQGFWDEFSKVSPSLAARVARFIHELIQKVKDKLFSGRIASSAKTVKDFKAVDKLAADIMTRYAQRLKKAAVAGDAEAIKELSAWHGSPHDHDKFSTEKIGTGEGAQAYGYGLYFAGNREVAEYYKKNLGDAATKIVGGDPSTLSPNGQKHLAQYQAYGNSKQTMIANAENAARLSRAYDLQDKTKQREGFAKDMDELVAFLKNPDVAIEKGVGKLYQVELAPAEDEYLLWDKPLSEQSEKVKAALKSRLTPKIVDTYKGNPVYELGEWRASLEPEGWVALHTKKGGRQSIDSPDDLSNLVYGRGEGQGLYKEVIKEVGSDKAASEYLHSLGIRGIKYADGNSRNRPIKDIKKAFLSALPEDAEFDDVTELIGTGKFSMEQESLLKALEADDWFGFDYPAQAISAALGNNLNGFDPSQALRDAVDELSKDQQFNYVIFNDEDVSITMKFAGSLNDVPKVTKAVTNQFKSFPYGQVLEDLSDKIYRFVMPVDRSVTLAASQKTFAPIKSLLNQFVRQRKEKAGRIQSDMTDGAHIWKRFEKSFKTDAEIQNFSDMVWNATEYELHADGAASGWNVKSWVAAGMQERTGKTLGQAKAIVTNQYKKLSPEQKIVHQEMLHHVQQMYMAGRQAELAWLDQAKVKEAEAWLKNPEGEAPELADLVKEVDEHYPTLRGDYMPLMRFGSLIVRTYEKDENGELGARTRTEFFDSPQDAKTYVEMINKTSDKHAKIETNPEYRKDVVNIPASLVDKISKAAAAQGITGQALEDLKQSIEGIRANMLPRNSITSGKLHREGVAGYEKDVVRVYLTYVRNHALANAQLTHGAKIEQTFRDTRNKVDALASEPNYDVDAVRRMSELTDHLYDVEKSGSREKVNEFTKTVGKVTFAWYLTSPSVFAVQWSQPFMVTIPKMGARHGFGKAFAAYTQAAKQYLHGNFSDDKIDAFDRNHEYVGQRVADILDRAREAKGAERSALDKELKSIYEGFSDSNDRRLLVLKVLSHQGQIDLAMAHNAQDIVAGANGGEKVLNSVIDKAAFFMQKSETGSRRAAAISAFELALANGEGFTAANDYASHIISDTLMDFDAQNRGAAWRGNTGRILGQFQFFRMHMVGKLAQLTKDAIGGEYKRVMAEATTQEEKDAAMKAMKEARKEFAYVMGSSFALAGAAGTPLAVLLGNTGMSALWGALAFMFGDDDDPWDPQREFELATREALGDTVGNVVLKGLPSLVGADISRRIGLGGMGDIIQGDPPAGLTGTAKANWYAGRILGPSWGMVSDTMRSADALADGDLSMAIRYSSPKGMRDVVKMFNVADKGVEAGGKTLLKPEDVSVWSMALMLSGVNPTEVSLAQEESRYLKNISTELSQRRSGLIKHLAEATVDQDIDAKESAIEKINKFSEAQPMLKITAQELAQKIKKTRDGREGKLTKREALIQEEYGKGK